MKAILLIIVMLMPVMSLASPGQLNKYGCHAGHCHGTKSGLVPITTNGHGRVYDILIPSPGKIAGMDSGAVFTGLAMIAGIAGTMWIIWSVLSGVAGVISSGGESIRNRQKVKAQRVRGKTSILSVSLVKDEDLSEADKKIMGRRRKRRC